MKRFIEAEDRTQVTLLPECLDDFIAEDNSVRVVNAFVEELDLQDLGFDGMPTNGCTHYDDWHEFVGTQASLVRISANVTGDFGNVTDLGLGAGLRG